MRRRGRPASPWRRPSPTIPCSPTPSTGARARQGPYRIPLLSPASTETSSSGHETIPIADTLLALTAASVDQANYTSKRDVCVNGIYQHFSISAFQHAPARVLRLSARRLRRPLSTPPPCGRRLSASQLFVC